MLCLKCNLSPSLSQLEQMCMDKGSALGDFKTTACQKQNIQAILDLLEQSSQEEPSRSTSLLKVLHLLISALDGEKSCTLQSLIVYFFSHTRVTQYLVFPLKNLTQVPFHHASVFCLSEMTNDCLAALGMCCSPAVLGILELLVSKSSTTCYAGVSL